jgi:4-hydroxybenzoyl-CoA thioesterase
MFHELIEDWFTTGLEVNYAEMILGGIGVPVVNIQCDFLQPLSMGSLLDLNLVVQRIGRSSVEVAIEGTHAGAATVRAQLVIVYTLFETMRSMPIPEDLRAAMARFRASQ